MNTATLIVENIKFKPLTTVFNLLLLAMGVAIILTLGHLNRQIENRFTRDLQGIDLVVSGKGSPLQIILSTIFHLDFPTGNIPISEAEKLKANPLVKSAIPMALGDNYNGYRIVGTTEDYARHYGGSLAEGRFYTAQMEAVIGSDAAQKYHVNLGDKIIGAHGLVNSEDLHTDFPYTVVGILAPTGSVLDRLVLTPVESVWHVHEHPDEDDAEEVAYKKTHPENELTALLITYASPYAAAGLPRLINQSSSMQGASPAFEVARLVKLMGTGSDVLNVFGILLMGFAAFGFFVTLYNAIHERQYDIALMRTLGASRGRIFTFVMAEALTLGISGAVLGFMLAHGFNAAISFWISQAQHVTLPPVGLNDIDLYVFLAALAVSLVAGIIPALRAHGIQVTEVLSKA